MPHERDFARFIAITAGSASETEYHLLLALEYLPRSTHAELTGLVNEVNRMLRAFHAKLMASG